MAHHSASGTASLPTMNMPILARQPQLSARMASLLNVPARQERQRPSGLAWQARRRQGVHRRADPFARRQ
jgi:hypothetical protein